MVQQHLQLLSPPPSHCHHHYHGLLSLSSSHTTPIFTFPRNRNLSKSLTSSLQLSVKSSQSEYFGPSSPPYTPKFISPPQGSAAKVFVSHSIYKGKSALTISPRAPTFVPLGPTAMKVTREGCIMLQFAPAMGVRQYDWSKKQVFTLSASEIGTLLSLDAKDSCEFYHDPNKGQSDEGQIKKVLRVEPMTNASGYFFNLGVQNKLLKLDETINIPVTKAEFAVLVSLFNFILPHILGWNVYVESTKPNENTFTNTVLKGGGTVDYEWSR